MNLLKRIKNVWQLSAYEVPPIGKTTSDYPNGTKVAQVLVSPPQKGSFIAFNRRDPVAEIVNQDPNVN